MASLPSLFKLIPSPPQLWSSCSVSSRSHAMWQNQASTWYWGVRQLRAGGQSPQGRWAGCSHRVPADEEGETQSSGVRKELLEERAQQGNSGPPGEGGGWHLRSWGGHLCKGEGEGRNRETREIMGTARMKCVCVCVSHIHTFPNSMCMCLCVCLSHVHTLPNYPRKRPEAAALLVPTYWFISVIKGWLQS